MVSEEGNDVEALYSEDIDIDFEDVLQDFNQNLWGLPRDIDWSQQGSVPDTHQQILADMVAQFSYTNTAELSLCGTILEYEHFLQPKMIAAILAVSKIRNIETWNKYLNHVRQISDVPKPDKEYFSSLNEQENTDSMLLGMSVIGKITWMALTDELTDIDEPVFQQIIDRIREQKEGKLELVRNHLQNNIASMTENEHRHLKKNARHYRGYARETVLYHRNTLDDIDRDVQTITRHVEEEITAFYNDIGLDI